MNADKKDTVLTTEELAERWGIHPSSIKRWRVNNKGPRYFKLGDEKSSKVLYRLNDVIRYENRRMVKTKEQ